MRVRTVLTAVCTAAMLTAGLTAGVAGAASASASAAQLDVAPLASVNYVISITTGNLSGAGTNSKVEVRINGSQGSSPFLELNDPGRDEFERGDTNNFGRALADLGTLRSVDVRFTRRSGDEHFEWHLALIRIHRAGHELADFPYHQWFRQSQTVNIPVA
ncbi:PLAT/LH2 domain-containing protein [Actinomadura sp. 6K520]|uniref:PLAT/LH2 domain-containing protein n=1 Tax=Actinomadura sp. 6K520 TaxID=2530364 RepID=UPI00104BBF2E|nr:PLAT/LH2 domain-containing protein [Actinomadura sp. 6K520]TDE27623.1 hypothetical protein E1289_22845 [Actinomadura sp. 6K520]